MAPSLQLVGAFVSLLAFAPVSFAYPYLLSDLASREINASQVLLEYDYVVAGGGTAGLVIAERLSEDPTKTVLVIEYGGIALGDEEQFQPSSATVYKPEYLFNLTAVPQRGLNNKANGIVYAAATAGGGSTVNGMMLDRGAPFDYDSWGQLNNPGWSFNDLLPYFRKSTHLTPPIPAMVEEFGITYDLQAYGQDSPIQLSYATFGWPGTKVQYQAALEAGVKPQKEQGLKAYGLLWFPSALDPFTVTRSAAVNRYYELLSSRRKNMHLLLLHRVNEVVFDESLHATGVTFQSHDTPNGEGVQTVNARLEVILTAGWLHTPHILQRSGIGPAPLLKEANIPVLVDLPGVGSNLQDHAVTVVSWNFETDVLPNPASLTNNATFMALAEELWQKNRTGPLSLGVGFAGAWLPLQEMASDYRNISAAIKQQNAAQYLPKSYTDEQVRGFEVQRDLLIESYLSNMTGHIELVLSGGTALPLSLEHPLSRGTVLLNTSDIYAEPLVDYNTFINPIDPLIVAKSYQFARKLALTPSFQSLTPNETAPGPAYQTDDELIEFARENTQSSTAHGSGTAALSPREHGGVVAPDLTVYGVTGLSVGDISIMPIIPGTHTCSTVYAIAEKAADMIKARHA